MSNPNNPPQGEHPIDQASMYQSQYQSNSQKLQQPHPYEPSLGGRAGSTSQSGRLDPQQQTVQYPPSHSNRFPPPLRPTPTQSSSFNPAPYAKPQFAPQQSSQQPFQPISRTKSDAIRNQSSSSAFSRTGAVTPLATPLLPDSSPSGPMHTPTSGQHPGFHVGSTSGSHQQPAPPGLQQPTPWHPGGLFSHHRPPQYPTPHNHINQNHRTHLQKHLSNADPSLQQQSSSTSTAAPAPVPAPSTGVPSTNSHISSSYASFPPPPVPLSSSGVERFVKPLPGQVPSGGGPSMMLSQPVEAYKQLPPAGSTTQPTSAIPTPSRSHLLAPTLRLTTSTDSQAGIYPTSLVPPYVSATMPPTGLSRGVETTTTIHTRAPSHAPATGGREGEGPFGITSQQSSQQSSAQHQHQYQQQQYGHRYHQLFSPNPTAPPSSSTQLSSYPPPPLPHEYSLVLTPSPHLPLHLPLSLKSIAIPLQLPAYLSITPRFVILHETLSLVITITNTSLADHCHCHSLELSYSDLDITNSLLLWSSLKSASYQNDGSQDFPPPQINLAPLFLPFPCSLGPMCSTMLVYTVTVTIDHQQQQDRVLSGQPPVQRGLLLQGSSIPAWGTGEDLQSAHARDFDVFQRKNILMSREIAEQQFYQQQQQQEFVSRHSHDHSDTRRASVSTRKSITNGPTPQQSNTTTIGQLFNDATTTRSGGTHQSSTTQPSTTRGLFAGGGSRSDNHDSQTTYQTMSPHDTSRPLTHGPMLPSQDLRYGYRGIADPARYTSPILFPQSKDYIHLNIHHTLYFHTTLSPLVCNTLHEQMDFRTRPVRFSQFSTMVPLPTCAAVSMIQLSDVHRRTTPSPVHYTSFDITSYCLSRPPTQVEHRDHAQQQRRLQHQQQQRQHQQPPQRHYPSTQSHTQRSNSLTETGPPTSTSTRASEPQPGKAPGNRLCLRQLTSATHTQILPHAYQGRYTLLLSNNSPLPLHVTLHCVPIEQHNEPSHDFHHTQQCLGFLSDIFAQHQEQSYREFQRQQLSVHSHKQFIQDMLILFGKQDIPSTVLANFRALLGNTLLFPMTSSTSTTGIPLSTGYAAPPPHTIVPYHPQSELSQYTVYKYLFTAAFHHGSPPSAFSHVHRPQYHIRRPLAHFSALTTFHQEYRKLATLWHVMLLIICHTFVNPNEPYKVGDNHISSIHDDSDDDSDDGGGDGGDGDGDYDENPRTRHDKSSTRGGAGGMTTSHHQRRYPSGHPDEIEPDSFATISLSQPKTGDYSSLSHDTITLHEQFVQKQLQQRVQQQQLMELEGDDVTATTVSRSPSVSRYHLLDPASQNGTSHGGASHRRDSSSHADIHSFLSKSTTISQSPMPQRMLSMIPFGKTIINDRDAKIPPYQIHGAHGEVDQPMTQNNPTSLYDTRRQRSVFDPYHHYIISQTHSNTGYRASSSPHRHLKRQLMSDTMRLMTYNLQANSAAIMGATVPWVRQVSGGVSSSDKPSPATGAAPPNPEYPTGPFSLLNLMFPDPNSSLPFRGHGDSGGGMSGRVGAGGSLPSLLSSAVASSRAGDPNIGSGIKLTTLPKDFIQHLSTQILNDQYDYDRMFYALYFSAVAHPSIDEALLYYAMTDTAPAIAGDKMIQEYQSHSNLMTNLHYIHSNLFTNGLESIDKKQRHSQLLRMAWKSSYNLPLHPYDGIPSHDVIWEPAHLVSALIPPPSSRSSSSGGSGGNMNDMSSSLASFLCSYEHLPWHTMRTCSICTSAIPEDGDFFGTSLHLLPFLHPPIETTLPQQLGLHRAGAKEATIHQLSSTTTTGRLSGKLPTAASARPTDPENDTSLDELFPEYYLFHIVRTMITSHVYSHNSNAFPLDTGAVRNNEISAIGRSSSQYTRYDQDSATKSSGLPTASHIKSQPQRHPSNASSATDVAGHGPGLGPHHSMKQPQFQQHQQRVSGKHLPQQHQQQQAAHMGQSDTLSMISTLSTRKFLPFAYHHHIYDKFPDISSLTEVTTEITLTLVYMYYQFLIQHHASLALMIALSNALQSSRTQHLSRHHRSPHVDSHHSNTPSHPTAMRMRDPSVPSVPFPISSLVTAQDEVSLLYSPTTSLSARGVFDTFTLLSLLFGASPPAIPSHVQPPPPLQQPAMKPFDPSSLLSRYGALKLHDDLRQTQQPNKSQSNSLRIPPSNLQHQQSQTGTPAASVLGGPVAFQRPVVNLGAMPTIFGISALYWCNIALLFYVHSLSTVKGSPSTGGSPPLGGNKQGVNTTSSSMDTIREQGGASTSQHQYGGRTSDDFCGCMLILSRLNMVLTRDVVDDNTIVVLRYLTDMLPTPCIPSTTTMPSSQLQTGKLHQQQVPSSSNQVSLPSTTYSSVSPHSAAKKRSYSIRQVAKPLPLPVDSLDEPKLQLTKEEALQKPRHDTGQSTSDVPEPMTSMHPVKDIPLHSAEVPSDTIARTQSPVHLSQQTTRPSFNPSWIQGIRNKVASQQRPAQMHSKASITVSSSHQPHPHGHNHPHHPATIVTTPRIVVELQPFSQQHITIPWLTTYCADKCSSTGDGESSSLRASSQPNNPKLHVFALLTSQKTSSSDRALDEHTMNGRMGASVAYNSTTTEVMDDFTKRQFYLLPNGVHPLQELFNILQRHRQYALFSSSYHSSDPNDMVENTKPRSLTPTPPPPPRGAKQRQQQVRDMMTLIKLKRFVVSSYRSRVQRQSAMMLLTLE